jgi:tetratricopeptide (TPR) repeat protein
MRFAVAATSCIAILALTPCTSTAQPTPLSARGLHPEDITYRTLLDRYLGGDVRGAVQEALDTDFETMERRFRLTLRGVNTEVQRLAKLKASQTDDTPFRRARADRLLVLRVAALLHTLAALTIAPYDTQLLDRQRWLAHEAVAEIFKLQADFDRFGPVRPSPNSSVTPPNKTPATEGNAISWPEIRAYVRLWYLVMASRLQDVANFDLLKPTLASGLERFRDDPELLLARGSLYEANAWLRMVDRSVAVQIYIPEALDQWKSTVFEAQADFDHARRKEPMLIEATLRWGRTRLLVGDEKDATAAFASVVNSRAPSWMRYLAFLFDGARAEAEKKPDQAQNAYQQALAVIPDAASALLALSRLAERAGDSAAARRWATRALRKTPDAIDPWTSYARGQAWQLEERLVAFKRLALQ